jgi:hypothetical protein
MTPLYFTDAEVDEMCAGLKQPAAKIRYLTGLGLRVNRKPNGQPLAWRPTEAPAMAVDNQPGAPQAANSDVVVGLEQWARNRKQRGQKTQGR